MSEAANLIMYAVAAASLLAAALVLARRPASEAALYRKRIAGTMLLALALILFGFATAVRTTI